MSRFPIDSFTVQQAIASAEKKTSGEIRVVICPHAIADPLSMAKDEFGRLQMERTKNRNAVLILVAPASRTFAVYADSGIHQKCGAEFWIQIAQSIEAHFRKGEFTDGLVSGIATAAQALRHHFPRQANDVNELPDEVVDRGTVV